MAGGPMLRAVLRQLSTAAAVRTLPTPCRARAPGSMGRQVLPGEPQSLGAPLGAFLSFREADDADMEVWDLDDGFALPPPLLDLGTSEFGGGLDYMDLGLPTPEGVASPAVRGGAGYSPCLPEGTNTEPILGDEVLKSLVERLSSQKALLPLAAAVLAGGRRYPHARPGPRAQAVKAGAASGARWMRFRQQCRGPANRQGSSRNGRQTARGR